MVNRLEGALLSAPFFFSIQSLALSPNSLYYSDPTNKHVSYNFVSYKLVSYNFVSYICENFKRKQMELPFIFGKLAHGNMFTNRKKEIEQLLSNFRYGINTILISPRRWGKSSLIAKASTIIQQSEPDIRIVNIDLFNIRTEEEFYKELTEKILLSTSGVFAEITETVKQFFKKIIPKISFSPGQDMEFSISLDKDDVLKQPDEILDLAENIAKSKNISIRICIDEFQNIAYFDDPLATQKKLRSHWQTHEHVAYFLYGSKRHMMLEVFSSPSMPFYNFGAMMFLQKITTEIWTEFIVKQFKNTGKAISNNLAAQIAEYADRHSYYVQQLAQLCWFNTEKTASADIIENSFHTLIMQLSLLFQTITDALSTTQINFLHAIVNEEEKLSSKDVINKYKLGTSANVSRMKNALIEKEIIDQLDGNIYILDPIYKAWLKTLYFKKNQVFLSE